MHGIAQRAAQGIVRPSAMLTAENTLQFPPLEAFEIQDLTDPGNSTGPLLELRVHGTGGSAIPPGYSILFNGVPVVPEGGVDSSVPAGESKVAVMIRVDPSLVNPSGNTVWLPNPSLGSGAIWVQGSFTPGAIAAKVAQPLGITPGGDRR